MDLRQDLHSLIESRSQTPGFVSLKELKGCMTEQKVKENMRVNGIPNSIQEHILGFPRLFAILVLLGREQAISNLSDVKDDAFFFLTNEDVPFQVGNSQQRVEFFNLQSRIPPMLTCKYPPQEFPHSFRPPVTCTANENLSGSYGIVSRVKFAAGHLPKQSSSEWLALKRIAIYNSQDDYLREVKTLKERSHRNLISLLACYLTPNGLEYQSQDAALYLIFPWADMTMSTWMRPVDARPPEHLRGLEEPLRRKKYLYKTILSLISAISYLHNETDGTFTSHHDLKPANILLLGERWTICDFGMTRLRSVDEGSQTDRKLGTYDYRPPECEDGSDRKHGRSFDIWSLGCIIVELAVLAVYGWESEKLSVFEAERQRNPYRLKASKPDDKSFHNNMSVVRNWMETMAREDGSRNFQYLIRIATEMLSMDPDKRPYSWEVQIRLYEQFHPDEPGHERWAKMEHWIQRPTSSSRHNPLCRANRERNWELVRYLEKHQWTLDSSWTNEFNIEELFESTCEALGYTSANTADLAKKFAAKVAPLEMAPFEVKYILEMKLPLKQMDVFTEKSDVDATDDHENTLLLLASSCGNIMLVNILLQYGAYCNRVNDANETPLIVASKRGHAAVVERLVHELELDIDFCDGQKRTPLWHAVENSHRWIAQILVKHEAKNGAGYAYGDIVAWVGHDSEDGPPGHITWSEVFRKVTHSVAGLVRS